MAIKSRVNFLLKPSLYYEKVKIMTGVGSSSCGACKFLRRKCTSECAFSPYFCYDEASTHFAAVHKVFGASNVSKLLSHLPLHNRSDAATTISYEALARMNNPIYGCVAHIIALQQQVAYLQENIKVLGTQMANTLKDGVASNITTVANSYNQFSESQFLTQNDTVLNVQQTQNQQEILIPNAENANVNNRTGSFELSAPCNWKEENMHFADPLDTLFEGMDQFNFRHSPWLDDTTRFGKQ